MSISTPHINVKPGAEIARSILLPGDPLRAKFIAENFLEDAVLFNDVRGILGYTGIYKGKKISAMGTGMGIPSISIYATELIKFFGAKNLIRVGSCGGLQENIKLHDILLAQACCTDIGFLRQIFPGNYAPIADFELLRCAYDKMTERNIPGHIGLIKSGDMFYSEEIPGEENWAKYGVIGSEMEGAALYTIAAKYRVRALTMATVVETCTGETELTAEEREKSLTNMITLALDSIIEFTD